MNAENILRRLRQRIFDYPEHKAAKAARVLQKLKARKLAKLPAENHSRQFSEMMLRIG